MNTWSEKVAELVRHKALAEGWPKSTTAEALLNAVECSYTVHLVPWDGAVAELVVPEPKAWMHPRTWLQDVTLPPLPSSAVELELATPKPRYRSRLHRLLGIEAR